MDIQTRIRELRDRMVEVTRQQQDPKTPHSDQELLDQEWNDIVEELEELEDIRAQEWYDAEQYLEEEEDDAPTRMRRILEEDIAKIDLELAADDMSMLGAEALHDHRNQLLRALDELERAGNGPCVVCAYQSGYNFMDGRCADCYWDRAEPVEDNRAGCARCAGCAYCAGGGGAYDHASEV